MEMIKKMVEMKIVIEVRGQNELQEVLEALEVNNDQITIVYGGVE